MLDFTRTAYKHLLESLLHKGYKFQPFANFLKNPEAKAVILRHDVDALPGNSLYTAQLEHELDIRGTYYFRIVPESNQPDIIRAIAKLGHEIGYHYEDLAMAAKAFKEQRNKGKEDERRKKEDEIYEWAIKSLKDNLTYFRQFGPVETICMHGSPLSRYDNRELWGHYNYRDFGIIGEPYFDIDFTKVLYLTDTGRRWDGERFSIRDKISRTPATPSGSSHSKDILPGRSASLSDYSPEAPQRGFPSHSHSHSHTHTHTHTHTQTPSIIAAAYAGTLPPQIMITVHPQRWTNNPLLWTRELVWQNVKNVVKRHVRWKI